MKSFHPPGLFSKALNPKKINEEHLDDQTQEGELPDKT
jgi:hypothetical protein